MTRQSGFVAVYLRVEGYTFDVCQYGLADEDFESKGIKPEFVKEGRIKIRGDPDGHENSDAHLFIPSRVPPVEPRKRRPSRLEDWIDDESGKVIGKVHVYDSYTILQNLKEAMGDLTRRRVKAIGSACGFMANINRLCVREASYLANGGNACIPCLMSSLSLMPVVLSSVVGSVIILTANSDSFMLNEDKLLHKDTPRDRIIICGLQDVPGFGAQVAAGETVDYDLAVKGIVHVVKVELQRQRERGVHISALLSECAELPGYTNTLREKFDLPVFDTLSGCNMIMHAVMARPELHEDPHHIFSAFDHWKRG